jgi:hypothetical protein
MRRVAGLFVLLVLAGTAGARNLLPKPRFGFQMRASPFTIFPGADSEWCEYRRLPNRKPMDVNAFRLRMPAGAHHFVIWAYGGSLSDDDAFPSEPVESVGCTGVSPDEFLPQVLIPIQEPNGKFEFPEGVSLHLKAREQVWLNPHMLNGGSRPLYPDIRFNFYRAKRGTVRHHAYGLVAGNITDIRIPAGAEQTMTAEWTAPVPIVIFQLATHQHRLGIYANIQLVDPDGIGRRIIYENEDWEHPWSFKPDPPIRLGRGQKMRITCRWRNTDDHEVRFGPETTDEMCFILGFFYRDESPEEAVRSQQCLTTARGFLCTFAPKVGD